MIDRGPKIPLPWKAKKTPARGSRRSRNWRRVYVGYTFPNTVWTVTQGPYQRLRGSKSKSFVTVVCGHCKQEYERRLDHLVSGKTRCCLYCAPRIHEPWEHGEHVKAARKRESKLVDGDSPLTADSEPVSETDTGLGTDTDAGQGTDTEAG